MKLIFALEDTIIGIICGLLLIGLTGKFFSLKLNSLVYVIVFIAYIFFILLDIMNEFKYIATHFKFILLSFLHNIIDIAISLVAISFFSGWNVPYITAAFVPYLKNETALFWVGIFLVVGNALWIVLYPFMD